VAFAPAVRGYPGGINDMTGEPDDGPDVSFDDKAWDPAAAEGRGGTLPRAEAAPAKAGSPMPSQQAPGQQAQGAVVPGRPAPPVPVPPVSVWQQSAAAWQEAGIDWLRPAAAGAPPADEEDPHTEPMPVLTADGSVRTPGSGDPVGRTQDERTQDERTQDERTQDERPPAASPAAPAEAGAGTPAAAEANGAVAEVNGAVAEVHGAVAEADVPAVAEPGGPPAGAEQGSPAAAAASAGGAVAAGAAGHDAPTTGEAAPGQDTGRGAADGETGTAAGATPGGASPAEADQAGPGGGPGASGQPTAGGRPEAGGRPGTDVRSRADGRPTGGGRRPRRRVTIVAVTALALIAGTLAGIGIARSGGGPAAPEFRLVTPYPPAVAADAELAGAAAAATALPVSLTGIAASGKTVVAIGAAPSQPGPAPLILLSTDGGHTWARAALAGPSAPSGPGAAGPGPTAGPGAAAGPGTAAGPAAGAGDVPVRIAHGGGLWLALAQRGAWISPDGKTWRPAPGLPAVPGDRVLGLAGTGSGFVAVGEHAGGRGGPVVWTSAGGRHWQRRSAAALRLTVRSGHVAALRWAAAQNGVFLAAGPVSGAAGRRRRADTGLWRSTDGGLTWAPATLPATHGATGGLAGLAANGSGFAAVRPGRKGRRLDAVIYLSAHGSSWRYAGRLAPVRRASLQVTGVSGSGHGFVVAATVHSSQMAFFSANGRGWHQTAYPGTGVVGLTAGTGPAVVVAGNGRLGTGPAGFRPHLLLIGSAGGRRQVGQSVLATAATPDMTVNGLARDGRTLVAAGAAGGSPALWLSSSAGRWAPAAALLPAPWRNGALLSVTHGGRGWLAIGQTGTPAPAQAPARALSPQPVIMMSATGNSWTPASGAGTLTAAGTTLAQAAAGPAGYVVVGSTSAGSTPVPAAWHSADLTTWAHVPLPGPGAGAAGGPAGSRRVLAVTAARHGFVAVGSAGSSPAVWASRNGSAWTFTALPRPAGAAGAMLAKVTAEGGRVVAVGYSYPAGSQAPGGTPFAAVSADGGRTWQESALATPAGPAVVTALSAAGHGFVAVGHAGLPGQPGMLAWWSSNGLTWHHAAPAGGGLNGPFVIQINAVTAGNGTLTGAGFAASPAAEHPVLWHARYR
jgi:hypothetical protein